MPVHIDGLSLEELIQLKHRVVERIKMLRAMQAHVDMMAFNLGARARFDDQEGRLFDTLLRYNRETVTVLTDDGRQWRVSPGLLFAVRIAVYTDTEQKQLPWVSEALLGDFYFVAGKDALGEALTAPTVDAATAMPPGRLTVRSNF